MVKGTFSNMVWILLGEATFSITNSNYYFKLILFEINMPPWIINQCYNTDNGKMQMFTRLGYCILSFNEKTTDIMVVCDMRTN